MSGPQKPSVAGWSSPVARQAHNLKVVGSNPTPATIYRYHKPSRIIPRRFFYARALPDQRQSPIATGDRGYDADWFRNAVQEKGITPVRVGNPAIRPSNTARVDIIGIPTASRSCSVAPKTGGASPPAMTGAATSSDPSSFSLPPLVQAMGLSLMK